ncbi:MAG: nucleoside triphosphate pyrophosphatase [Thermodesulfobacteriota bacterium]
MTGPPLILASASPRRRELLAWAGIEFEVFPVEVDESVRPGEDPAVYARRLALAKAEAAAVRFPGRFILSADTVVVLDGRIMGKPRDARQAADMLADLSGRVHQVITGFCLLGPEPGRLELDHVTTQVEFRTLSARDIAWYINLGEVWDKAGAYAIQGCGAALSRSVKGSYTNVIGLPLAEVLEALRRLGGAPPYDRLK